MKSTLITVAIFAAILGGVLLSERKTRTPVMDEAQLQADEDPLQAWVEEMRAEHHAIEQAAKHEAAKSPKSIPELIEMASDPSYSVREEAVRELAKSGREDVIPAMKRAFSDKEESVRNHALWGAGDALDEDAFRETKTSAAFKAAMFDLIATLVPYEQAEKPLSVGDEFTRQCAIKLLPKLMPAKAAEYLQHPSIFHADNPDFDDILESLSNAGIPVNADLDKLLDDFRSKAQTGTYSVQCLYGELLRAAATQKHPRARELIQEVLTSFEGSDVADKAAEAQWILLGLSPTLDNDIFVLLDRAGPDKLAKPLQQYIIVTEYYDDAINGGHSQYFLNSFSNSVRANVIALNEMGAVLAAYEISTAMKLFGPKGPPVDQKKRREMMYANNSRLFDLIDGIKAPENIKQKYETNVHAKLYLAKFPEICKTMPRRTQ